MDLLGQVAPPSFWNGANNSGELFLKIALGLIAGLIAMAAMLFGPPRFRRPIVFGVTFLSGLYYFLIWCYPAPIGRGPADAPRGSFEAFSFWLADAQPVAANIANIIAGFLIGLSVFSLLRIHLRRVARMQTDWFFSLTLVVSMAAMAIFGFWAWNLKEFSGQPITDFAGPSWGWVQYTRDLLFDGLLQQMDAAMFSLIAFYILSAAYRAFRARSVEATILLVAALVVMLSLMGLVEFYWDQGVQNVAHGNGVVLNLQISQIAAWLKNTVQTASIRGLDFGVGIGLMAMALRIWLGLESVGAEA